MSEQFLHVPNTRFILRISCEIDKMYFCPPTYRRVMMSLVTKWLHQSCNSGKEASIQWNPAIQSHWWGTLSSPIAWLTSCKAVWSLQNPQGRLIDVHDQISWGSEELWNGLLVTQSWQCKIHWTRGVILVASSKLHASNTCPKGEEVRWLIFFFDDLCIRFRKLK